MTVQPDTVRMKRGIVRQVVNDEASHHGAAGAAALVDRLREELVARALPVPPDSWLDAVAAAITADADYRLTTRWVTEGDDLEDIYAAPPAGDPDAARLGSEGQAAASPRAATADGGPAPRQNRTAAVSALLAAAVLFVLWRRRRRRRSRTAAESSGA
jgi:MYXO-CTERM domain-containing protein